MEKKYRSLVVNYNKAKETSFIMQQASNDAIKDANMQNFKKEKEIRQLEKNNQKLIAENETYESLLSDEVRRQRRIEEGHTTETDDVCELEDLCNHEQNK